MASKAASDEGVEDESCGLPTSFRVRSLEMESLLFLRSAFLVLVGITTGFVVDCGVSMFGGTADFPALSFLETRSAIGTDNFSLSLCFVMAFEGGDL